MKRNSLPHSLRRGLLAVPAAALMLGAAQAAQVGLNFQDNYGGAAYAPVVAGPAFGLDLAQWFNVPSVLNSENGGGISSSAVAPLPGGGAINVAWSCVNTYSIYNPLPTTGDEQVIYGYLDDSGSGYSVTLSGLRGFASAYSISTIASTDSGSAFEDAAVTTASVTNLLQYLNNYQSVVFNTGLAGTSTVSSVITTLAGNDSVTIKGLPRNGTSRSCLAGILIEYTPSNNNPPLIEVNPQSPTGNLYPGGSFALKSLASGTPTLHYQWRKGGAEIPGANFPDYTNTSTVVGDTGGYDVVVTNNYGGATSTVAQVTILNVVTPVITKSPLSQSLYQGYPAVFAVEATGGQLSYQWKSNGVTVSGATNASFTLPSISTNNAGTYSVAVSNPVGPVAAAAAALTVKVPTPGSYEAVVAGTKPALWLRYGETGPVLQDTAANAGSLGANGTGLYSGSVAQLVTGALVGSTNRAATLSGGKITVPFNAALNPAGTFTVDCWINPNASGTGLIVQEMINGENPNNTSDRSGWALRQNNTGLRFYVGAESGAPFYYYYTTANGVITSGVWQHVAVVYDDLAPSIYINGVLAPVTVTRQDNVPMTQPEIDAIRIVPNFAAPLIIGDRGYGGWTFAGSVDEVALYPSALTPTQLLAHYQNGTNATPTPAYDTLVNSEGAVEYLRLNDPVNLSPAANAGTWGAAWTGTYNDAGGVLGSPMIAKGAAGPRPASYPGFASDNDSVTMTNGFGSSPAFGITTDTLTVTCWIKREAVFSTGDLSWLAWVGSGGMHLNLTTSPTPGELRYHWDGTQWDWGSGLIVPADVWTFCAMVLQPDQVTFYMSDGNSLLQSGRAAIHTPHLLSTPPGFGGGGGGSSARNYIGQIDESTFYDRALTPSEITTLFMVGTGAPLTVGLVPGGTIVDSKPVGTPNPGANYLTTWQAVSPGTPVSRTGVEQFIAATNSQIKVPASADFNSTAGTFTFWVRVPVAGLPGPGNEGAILVDRRTDQGMVILLNDAGNIAVQWTGDTNTLTSGANLVDDTWHLVAVTYNQANGAPVEILIDGVASGSQANSSTWSWPTAQPVELGRSHDTYWKRYDGQLDDFRIYNRVLTQGEIATIYSGDALVDNAALKLRFNFSTAGSGNSVTWPFGTLLSSPVLGPAAIWTPVLGAEVPVYPIFPTGPAQFFRATP